MTKQILVYLEMIFGKYHEQTIRQPQFKFDPLPTDSTQTYLFHERWIKAFETQPFCQLYIKYGLVCQKNDLDQFLNKYMVGPSQKNSFWTLEKWKMIFPSNENQKFLSQHCLPLQYAPLCIILDRLNELCHECGHKIDHLAQKP